MKIKTKPLTTGEAANYCDVNFRTVIRWIEKGYLKAYKLPGRGDNRIPVDTFIEFLRNSNMPIPVELEQRNNRILIVEDIPEMAKAIARTLNRQGYQTEIAKNGFEAGDLLNSFKPALMTLDIKIPGMSGLDVLRYTKAKPSLKNIKILIISAQDEKNLLEAVEAGADRAISKPFSNDELHKIVASLIGQSSES